ncbi:hypothetical protein [Kosmotoga pacifica]|uniref:Uncharacterized protein n=1 Tax=Kosmotoga pacifica TaxID=1330330 RepID=A0A0G2Z975_9BACT|nr:hypothetical protein [Kosmotoga pacifica]AKI98112.1 hypothetical protein IX53_10030 [Kosmotoga pacifica]
MERRITSDLRELMEFIRSGWILKSYEISGKEVLFHLEMEPGKFNWSEDPELKKTYGGDWSNDE